MADASQIPAGWYPDPSGDVTRDRWWDGNQWTDHYQAHATATPATVVTPTSNPNYAAGVPGPIDAGAQPVPTYSYAAPLPPEPKNNGLAIGSLVLGIASACSNLTTWTIILWWGGILGIIMAVVGLILGIMARKKAPTTLATAGIIINAVALALCLIFTISCGAIACLAFSNTGSINLTN